MFKGVKVWTLVGFLFIYLIPLCTGFWLYDAWKNDYSLRERDQTRADLSQMLSHLRRISQPVSWLQEEMDRFVRALKWSPATAQQLGRRLLPFGKLFVYEESGKRIPLSGSTSGLKFVSEKCLRFIQRSIKRSGKRSGQENQLVQSLFGSGRAIEQIAQSPGRLVNLGNLGFLRLAGYFPVVLHGEKRGFLVAIFELPRIDLRMLAAQGVRHMQRLAGNSFSFGLFDLAKGKTSHGNDFPLPVFRGLLKKRYLEISGKVYIREILRSRFLLYGSTAIAPKSKWLEEHFPGLLVLAILGFVLLIFLIQFLINYGIPLRIQLLAFFGAAALASIIALLGVSRQYLDAREQALIRQHQELSQAILARLDSSFENFQRSLSKRFFDLRDVLSRVSSRRAFQGKLNKLSPAWKEWVTILVFDAKGRIAARSVPNGTSQIFQMVGTNTEKFYGEIASWSIYVHQWQKKNPQSVIPKELNQTSPMTLGGVASIVLSPNRLAHMSVGNMRLNIFNAFFRGAAGNQFLMLAFFERNIDEKLFLRKMRKLWRKSCFPMPFSFELFGVQKREKVNLPMGQSRKALSCLKEFHDLVNHTKTRQTTRTSIRGKMIALVARPGQSLGSYNLFLSFSLDPIIAETARYYKGFLFLGCLMMGFALCLGYIFSHLVVYPLQELFTGCKNLATSRFLHPVRLQSGDEFEELGNGVNELLNEMNELNVAKSIQAQLIPDKPLRNGDYRLQGWSRSPSEIGGELFDLFPCQSEYLVFSLIRVPGCAVASALRLAAIKTEIRVRFSLEVDEPKKVVSLLGKNLSKGVEEPIESLVGLLNVSTGLLKVAWSGKFFFGSSVPGDDLFSTMTSEQPDMLSEQVLTILGGQSLLFGSSSLLTGEGKASLAPGVPSLREMMTPLWEIDPENFGTVTFEALNRWHPEESRNESQTFILVTRRKLSGCTLSEVKALQ